MIKNRSVIRNFILEVDGKTAGTFTGRQPRPAAIKAANSIGATEDKPAEIILRESGTDTLHVFTGWVKIVKAPEKRPPWMPAEIRKAFVKKVRTEKKAKPAGEVKK